MKNTNKTSAEKYSRRKAIKKAGYYALSMATLMVLMNTQAKAQTSPESPAPPPSTTPWD